MPVYEYQCNACGHAFEEWQKITEAAIKTCPSCAKDAVERLISQTAFMLKGGGWYKDLYSSGKAKPDSKSDSKTESKSDSGSKESSGDSGDKGSAKAGRQGGGDKGGGGGGGGDKGGGGGGGRREEGRREQVQRLGQGRRQHPQLGRQQVQRGVRQLKVLCPSVGGRFGQGEKK